MSDDVSTLPESSGATIGPYEIVNVLHRGASATVYLAIVPGSDRELVLKVVAAAARDLPVDKFSPHVTIARRLVHRHIARVLDSGEDGGLSYVVIERLHGRSLGEIIADPTFRPDLATRIDLAAQLCIGLHHAHEHGVVHGNVTPDNVFVTDDGVVKILNFGAVSSGDRTVVSDNAPSGGFEYMSPEHSGGEVVDGRSDLFSAAAILYELVSGRLPFQGSATVVPLAPIREDAASLEGMAKLDVVIRRALDRDPSKRFASAQEFAYALWMVHLPDIDTGGEEDAEGPAETVYAERNDDVNAQATTVAPEVEAPQLSRQPLIYGAIAAVIIIGVAGGVMFGC